MNVMNNRIERYNCAYLLGQLRKRVISDRFLFNLQNVTENLRTHINNCIKLSLFSLSCDINSVFLNYT